MTISIRPEATADEPFLRRLILETRSAQLAAKSWPDAIRETLLETQYRVYRQGFQNWPAAVSRIVLLKGEPAGWFVTCDLGRTIHLLNIMVAQSCQGTGVGSAVMRILITDSERFGKPVRLEVDVANQRAIRLYSHWGFRRVGGDELHHQMERPAEPRPSENRADI